MNAPLTQEDNLIIQSYLTVDLLTTLHANKVLESDFFSSLKLTEARRNEINQVGIDNQGTLLMFLYALLVVPKEIIGNKHPDEYNEINKWLQENSLCISSNYHRKDDYIRHIRNAVAHARVEFIENDRVIFKDKNRKGNSFTIEILLSNVFRFLEKLKEVHKAHFVNY